MTSPRILIAGIGNIFFGDDAFGTELARRRLSRPLPDGVRVVDFGIRGIDLTYALIDGYDAAILVDATPRGGAPGTLYVIEPDVPGTSEFPDLLMEPHGMDPMKVLRLAANQGGLPRRVFVVGCEPATLGSDDDPVMGLSPPVEAAVEEAIRLIDSLVAAINIEYQDLGAPTPDPHDQALRVAWRHVLNNQARCALDKGGP